MFNMSSLFSPSNPTADASSDDEGVVDDGGVVDVGGFGLMAQLRS